MTSTSQKPRVRFAPSPTGPLHIGGVRTALYNYLFARHFGGDMLLRIEDTDSKRFVPGAEAYILEALNWLGIEIDEGVGVGGECGPYRQSERRDIYREYVAQLLREGKAYKAYDTAEELEAARNAIPNFQYDATTRNSMKNDLVLSEAEVRALEEAGVPYVVRIKIEPGEEVVVNDLIRGEVRINSSIIDDKVLYKSSDDLPTYHLANIVDDHLMGITHVIRGEEWLPSAPLHKLLYRALGWEDTMPQFAHLALLLKPEGNGKLSKRDGDRLGFPVFPLEWHDPESKAISMGYRESGYLPEAVVNFLALLGWNPGDNREVMTREELIEAFSLDKCSKSGAKFDFEKGKWFNHRYLQEAPIEHIATLFTPILEQHHVAVPANLESILSVVRDRVQLIPQLWDETYFFFLAPEEYDEKTVKKRWKAESSLQMREIIDLLNAQPAFESEALGEALNSFIQTKEYSMGGVMNALRLALVGAPKGPHINEIIYLLGREESIRRIERAIAQLG
ncbi:glutamate--tRNA ligase [uncultured Porphyromonas sp.]|uniref:glutamate--tRNA ligase n=1 Tax=uncultured Porphyromonas sp. TaxID=159274 RepID=UPI002633E2D2|nr:glutamate--tRNA ligase [uncultured Porphyromonas sp.]